MTNPGATAGAYEEPQELLEARAHHFAQAEDAREGDGDTELFLIPEGAAWLGLPLTAISKVQRAEGWAPVPFAPTWCHGLVNLRGEILAIVDLAAFLGLRRRASLASTIVGVVVETGVNFLVPVEGRTELAKIRSEELEPVPPLLDGRVANHLSGIIRLESGLVLVVNLDQAVDALKAELDRHWKTEGATRVEALR